MTCFDTVLSEYEKFLQPGAFISEAEISLPTFDAQVISELTRTAVGVLSCQSSLIEIPVPSTLIGDIHGNIFDLLRILQKFANFTNPDTLLFLGDYVDRGRHSLEVITLLLALLCKYPQKVFLLRGNHEFGHMNKMYGFHEQMKAKYHNDQLWSEFQNVFAWLPLAAVVGGKIFCVHGGPSPGINSLDQIRAIQRPLLNYDDDSRISDLVWSDPHDTVATFTENHRGCGLLYGAEAVKGFLKGTGLKLLVRAHQCVADGFCTFAQNVGVTLFSSSEYCRLMHNKCGVMCVQPKGRIEIYSLDAKTFESPTPKVTMVLGKELGMKRVFARNPALPRRTSMRKVEEKSVSSRQPKVTPAKEEPTTDCAC